MRFQPFYVFKEYHRWFVVFKNTTNIKEQGTSNLVLKSLLFTRITKRLTWETCGKNVKSWYIFCFYSLYIACRNFVKIGFVCLLSKFIIVRRENTFHLIIFHGKAKTTNTAEKIYAFVFVFHNDCLLRNS